MAGIMARLDGIGLAAPQVGIPERIVIIDAELIVREREPSKPLPPERYLKLVNPEILALSDDSCKYEEGCLSVPAIYADVMRPSEVEIAYSDENGAKKRLRADGVLARCILHELDHLEGRLFIDYLSPLKRRLIVSKLKKLKA
jgi:peptide deformylase